MTRRELQRLSLGLTVGVSSCLTALVAEVGWPFNGLCIGLSVVCWLSAVGQALRIRF